MVGYGPWGCEESGTTEVTQHTHTQACISFKFVPFHQLLLISPTTGNHFFTVCISLTLVLIYSLSDTMHYLSFSAWHISLSATSSRSIHVVPPHGISFSRA